MTAGAVVYLLRCADGSLYCGWTCDLDRRLRQHNGELAGGGRYTASRRPVTVAAVLPMPDRSAAMREEARIKRLSKAGKEQLVRSLAQRPQTSPAGTAGV